MEKLFIAIGISFYSSSEGIEYLYYNCRFSLISFLAQLSPIPLQSQEPKPLTTYLVAEVDHWVKGSQDCIQGKGADKENPGLYCFDWIKKKTEISLIALLFLDNYLIYKALHKIFSKPHVQFQLFFFNNFLAKQKIFTYTASISLHPCIGLYVDKYHKSLLIFLLNFLFIIAGGSITRNKKPAKSIWTVSNKMKYQLNSCKQRVQRTKKLQKKSLLKVPSTRPG